MSAPRELLLQVENLHTQVRTPEGVVRAVDGVSFGIASGRTLGIVGESGCGKSVTALSILGLAPQPPFEITGGRVLFEGSDLLSMDTASLQNIRGNRIGMIFQEPMTSLNPAYPVGDQITEAILRHRPVGQAEARAEALALMRQVRIPAPEQRIDDYPHRLSGGMRQRVMIAMALACRPALLIADEPTTALDVTIQAQILTLLRELRERSDLSIMLITHDLGVIAALCDEVIVMYAGKVVESAAAADLFHAPQHPYTIGLLGSVPSLSGPIEPLAAIQGMVPNPTALPAGCRFQARCPFRIPRCAEQPPLVEVAAGHQAACWRAPLDPDRLQDAA